MLVNVKINTLKEVLEYLNITEEELQPSHWSQVTCLFKLSEEFMDKYIDELDWYDMCEKQELSEEFMDRHNGKINWSVVSENQKFSTRFALKYADCIWFKRMVNYNDKIDSLSDEWQTFFITMKLAGNDLLKREEYYG